MQSEVGRRIHMQPFDDEQGFALFVGAIEPGVIDMLDVECRKAGEFPATSKRLRPRPGVRIDLAEHASLNGLLNSDEVRSLADNVLGRRTFPTRAILFQKTQAANWKVAWHQDLTIAVRQRKDVPGWGPWSRKDGLPHVQPPLSVLEWMITLRIHLDECGLNNGPLAILPGSHRGGRLTPAEIEQIAASNASFSCIANRGDVLLMRPLLLHRSSSAPSPSGRRILHVEYAADPLPNGLDWHCGISVKAAIQTSV